MITIPTRNAHRALSHALFVMDTFGYERPSRNGPVKLAPFPVTTEYERPMERVIFWPERDANPFYHLYEALWMLVGGNDITVLSRFAKNVKDFSDDGRTWHGAYGHRWRIKFGDQLYRVVRRLQKDPDDRRCVIQIWDAELDLDKSLKDVPCNVTATVQRDREGRLDLTVFCRSNDIIWGCYGANVVHFSMLQEYLAYRVGCPAGTYRQVSVNWHAYLSNLHTLDAIPRQSYQDPYYSGEVHPVPMSMKDGPDQAFLAILLDQVRRDRVDTVSSTLPWQGMAVTMMAAHQVYRLDKTPERYDFALAVLARYPDQKVDWIVAGREWLTRRRDRRQQ